MSASYYQLFGNTQAMQQNIFSFVSEE